MFDGRCIWQAGAKTYKVFIAPIGRLARTSVVNPNNLLSYPFLPRHESGRADNEFIDDYGSGTTRFACKYAYVTKLAASRLVVFEPSLFRSFRSPLTFSSSFLDLFRRPRCSHLRLRLVRAAEILNLTGVESPERGSLADRYRYSSYQANSRAVETNYETFPRRHRRQIESPRP